MSKQRSLVSAKSILKLWMFSVAAPLNVSPTTGNEKTPEKNKMVDDDDDQDMIMETAETLLALSGKKNHRPNHEAAHQSSSPDQTNSKNIVKELRAQRKIQKGELHNICPLYVIEMTRKN